MSDWGADFIQINCCASYFASVDLKETVEFILFFQIDILVVVLGSLDFFKNCYGYNFKTKWLTNIDAKPCQNYVCFVNLSCHI